MDDDTPDQARDAGRVRTGLAAGHTHPDGMLRAHAYWSEDEREIIGVSFWASRQSCDAWRASSDEARRRQAMADYVMGEHEAFYRGRELHVPDH